MNETRKRIKAYKSALPGLRERVFATALLFALSAAIMTVSSFAWFTLSKAPEVSGISTQLAANGNLEIALSGSDGVTPPGQSQIGDSSAADGQTIFNSNLTWGNLVNLSDPIYGLDRVILRPAVLNNDKLGTEPFRSVVYGEDGRVSNDQNSKFSYCTWEPANDEIATPHFGVTGKYGVRAIASVTERFEAELGGTAEEMVKYYGYLGIAEAENSKVDTIYQTDIINDTESINALATIVGYYMQARVNSDASLTNPECTNQIASLSKLYNNFKRAMEQELNAMVALANVQQYVHTKSESYTPYSAETLRNATHAELTEKGVHLENFATFIADLGTVETDSALIADMAKDVKEIGTQVYLQEIKSVIDKLVNVNSCVIKAGDVVTTVEAISGIEAALEIAGVKPVYVIIQDGILARFEQRAGSYVNTAKNNNYPKDGVEVTVSVKREVMGIPMQVPATVAAHISTQYDMGTSLFANDVAWTQSAFENSGLANGKKILTAGDTYGLAVDFWVRTNAGDPENGISYLVLEGELQYEQDAGTDEDENEVGLLFYYTVKDEATEKETKVYVYQTEDGKWFEDYAYQGSNRELTAADLAGKQLQEAYKDAPVGYEGENRVWEEIQQATLQPPLSEFNTTQGSGSCYTFYAESPQDQQILNLLKHMYVVFTDGGNDYLSMARFDTEENHYYAVGGKYTVPLVITDSDYTFTNALGEVQLAVAQLQQDVATRITAMVYLDGKELTNKEALSASDVQGILNIQFGNSIVLTTLGDQELQQQERRVSATVTTTKSDNVLDFYTDDLTPTVTVNVTGDQPATVTAFFQREINAFQGSRQQTMTFRQVGESWVCDDYTFPAPGKYVLRSVMLDGVEYDLTSAPEVTVQGTFLHSLTVSRENQLLNNQENTIMTADNTVSLQLAATFAADSAEKQPKKIVVEFVRSVDGSAVSVELSSTTNGWTGTARIGASGYYQMSYVLLDGERYDLDTLGKNFDMYLGLSAVVEAMPGTPQIVPLENDDGVTLGIRTRIVDNSGASLRELPAFSLRYKGDGTGEELESVVVWNGQTGYYEGNFHLTQPDAYRFYYLETQGNYISVAKSAVVFIAKTNKPASYEGCTNSGDTKISLPGETPVELLVKLRNVPGGTPIQATYRNGKGETHTVDKSLITPVPNSTVDGVTTWKIPVPTVNGSQAGDWTLVKLAMGNVMDGDGREYTEENPLIFTLADEAGGEPTVTVISEFEVKLNNIAQNSFSGEFMQAHTISDLSVELYFKDAAGNPVALPENWTISEVKLHYSHVLNSNLEKGGYSIGGATVPEIVVAMKDSGNRKTFTQSEDLVLRTAGVYNLSKITYRLNLKDTTKEQVSGNAAQLTVTSTVPTVTVGAIAPEGKNKAITKKGFMQFSESEQTSEVSADRLTATVYNKGKKSWGVSAELQTYPQVTLKLVNAGLATKATMTFANANSGGNVGLYTSQASGQTSSFNWTRSNDVMPETSMLYVGYYETDRNSNWNPTGTLTCSTLVLTYDGVNYNFAVPTITIKNPI